MVQKDLNRNEWKMPLSLNGFFGSLRWKQNPRWCLSSFQFMWDSLLLPIALQGFADTLATLASMIEITEGL